MATSSAFFPLSKHPFDLSFSTPLPHLLPLYLPREITRRPIFSSTARSSSTLVVKSFNSPTLAHPRKQAREIRKKRHERMGINSKEGESRVKKKREEKKEKRGNKGKKDEGKRERRVSCFPDNITKFGQSPVSFTK